MATDLNKIDASAKVEDVKAQEKLEKNRIIKERVQRAYGEAINITKEKGDLSVLALAMLWLGYE